MDKKFSDDFYEGLQKIIDTGKNLCEGFKTIIDIGTWLLDCLKIEIGRNIEIWKKDQKEKNKIIIIYTNSTTKE